MHEYSLVRALLREVDKLLTSAGDVIVTGVRVQIGPLSGVEPLLLTSAFAKLAANSSIPQAELNIEEVPLTAVCRECGLECEIADLCFRCPHCQATSLRVTRGDAMLLDNILVEPRIDANGVA